MFINVCQSNLLLDQELLQAVNPDVAVLFPVYILNIAREHLLILCAESVNHFLNHVSFVYPLLQEEFK